MAQGFQLSFAIEGQTQLSRRLIGLGQGVTDMSTPFHDTANLLEGLFSREVFATQGGVIGEKWKPLSPYTIAQKARRGYPPDPLIGSGAMQRSFRSSSTESEAVIWNTSPYFKYHQSRLPRTHLPRRVMMKLGEQQKQQIVKIFQTYLYKLAHS